MARHYDADAEERAGAACEAMSALCDLLMQQRDDSLVRPRELSSLITLVMQPAREMVETVLDRRPSANDEG